MTSTTPLPPPPRKRSAMPEKERATMNRPLRTLTPRRLMAALALAVTTIGVAVAGGYVAADQGALPVVSTTSVLPERYLRGYDPVTVVFPGDTGPGAGPADDPSAFATMKPAWPGAWSWADRRTLQFRPAEPWPALARFAVEIGRAHV